MKRIYWKIFIWFWVATSLSIIITALISSQVTQRSSNDSDNNALISAISAAAIIMVDQGSPMQFDTWREYLQHHYGITLMLLPVFTDIDEQQFTPPFKGIARHMRDRRSSNEAFIRPPFIVSQPIIAANGQPYRLIAKLPEDIFQKYKFNK